jgi:hypothetical protein
MSWKTIQNYTRLVLAMIFALALLWSGVALAGTTWVDEVWNMVMFEKASHPESNFDPYLQKLDRIRTGLDREDPRIVKIETDRFLKMLIDRKHGINDVAADEIYNFLQSVRPAELNDSTAATSPIELSPDTERPISVPDHTINTPYQGGQVCEAEGCDYWLDDVYDPGAAG